MPERIVGDQIAIANRAGGSALILESTAALVWSALRDWQEVPDLERMLADRYPFVSESDRHEALMRILDLLVGSDLLERSAP